MEVQKHSSKCKCDSCRAKWKHGSPSTYNNKGCRCDLCRAAWAEYMAPRVKKFREDKRKEKADSKRGVNFNF